MDDYRPPIPISVVEVNEQDLFYSIQIFVSQNYSSSYECYTIFYILLINQLQISYEYIHTYIILFAYHCKKR